MPKKKGLIVRGYSGVTGPFLLSSRIYFAQLPLRHQHLDLLELTKNRETNRQIQASWAMRGWGQTVGNILHMAVDGESLRFLKFGDGNDTQPDCKTEDARTFLRLLVRTASAKAWSMAVWSEIPPLNWAGVIHQDSTMRKQALRRMEEEFQVMLFATGTSETGDGVAGKDRVPFHVFFWGQTYGWCETIGWI